GIGISVIADNVKIPRWLPALGIVGLVVLLPHPFAVDPMTQVRDTEALIRANVPEFSKILGTPIESYSNSLYADHFTIDPLEGTNFDNPVLVNAYKANPDLQYVLLTYIYPPEYYKQWFSEWDAAYPDLHWKLVAEKPELKLALYHLETGK